MFNGEGVTPGGGSPIAGGVTNGGGQRNTSARMSSPVSNERIPVSPPALTIFFLKSLTELSVTEATRMQPSAAVASVLKRTWPIARFSASSAQAVAATSTTSRRAYAAVIIVYPLFPHAKAPGCSAITSTNAASTFA